nr:hypothetical protein [Oceanococcus sp. HetDA_MAG_MS8]
MVNPGSTSYSGITQQLSAEQYVDFSAAATWLLFLGVFFAPCESLRVSGALSISDLCIGLAIAVKFLGQDASTSRMWLPLPWVVALILGLVTALWQLELNSSTYRQNVTQYIVYSYIHIVVPLVIVQWYSSGPRVVPQLVTAWILGSTLSALVAVMDANGLWPDLLDAYAKDEGRRFAGMALHSTSLGFNVSMALAATSVLFIRSRSWMGSLVWLLVLYVNFSAANLSGSRSSLLAPVVGLVFVVCFSLWSRHFRWSHVYKLILVSACVALAPVLIRGGPAPDSQSAYSRLSGAASSVVSDYRRAVRQAESWEDIWERPVLGNGYHTIGQAHHRLLELLEAGGLVMCFSFALQMAFMYLIVISAWRKMSAPDTFYMGLIAANVAYWSVFWAHSGLFSRTVGVLFGLTLLGAIRLVLQRSAEEGRLWSEVS